MLITSCIDGRIRVRDGLLRDLALAGSLSRLLLNTPGVREVSANPRSGSLLIVFQQARITLRQLTALLERFFGSEQPGTPAPKAQTRPGRLRLPGLAAVQRQAVNLGMLASLLVSLLGAVLGAKLLHIISGAIFMAALGVHLFDKRRSLFA